MPETDAKKMQSLAEAIKKMLKSEGVKGRTQRKTINEALQQLLHEQEGKPTSEAWVGAEDASEQKLPSAPNHDLRISGPASGPSPAVPSKQPCGYGATLIATSVFLPSAAAVFTMAVVLVEWLVGHRYVYSLAPLWAALSALGVWLVFAGFCREAADARHAIPSSYGELLPRLAELKTRLKYFGPAAESAKDLCKKTAYYEARRENREIGKELAARGFTWLLATGYSRVWGRLYHAEEAMIEVMPRQKVLEGAYYDEARLEGSDIPNREDLLAKLRKAVVTLDPSAQKYLKSTAGLTLPPALAIGTTALAGGTVAGRYCASLLATGGVPPYQWAVIGGAIPEALVLSSAGALCGTPLNDGHAHFTLQLTDSAGVAVQKDFDLLIGPSTSATTPDLTIGTPRRLPCGTVDEDYVERLFATGGTPPYTWKELPGGSKSRIPQGMSLSKEGVLSGKPVTDDPGEFEVEVMDSANPAPEQVRRKFVLLVKPAGTAAVPAGGTEPEQLARAALRHVRTAINGYRNDRWNGLIQARNHLLATFALTTMVIFALLATAVMCGAPRKQIIAATVFYLVGATVGLCNRLRNESQAVSAVLDYGLSAARRITLPLFSGLGALGGLLFVAYLPFAAPVFAPESSTPLAISTDMNLPPYTLQKSYRTTLLATGGTRPYEWTITEDTKNAVPPDLTLTKAGLLSGTPKEARQRDRFVARVTDSTGVTFSKQFLLRPSKPPAATGGKGDAQVSTPGTGTGGEAAAKEDGAPAATRAADSPGKKADQGSKTTTAAQQTDASNAQQNEDTGVARSAMSEKVAQAPAKLEDVFDLQKNLIGILVAMVFGLAPGMLFDRLQQQADRYKADLKSSQPAEGTSKS